MKPALFIESAKRFAARLFFCGALCTAILTGRAEAGFLYVLNDAAAGNQIYGFAVDESTGALAALPGFPVATGFAGGAATNLEMVAIDRVNQRLYAINRGSNNISAYSIDQTTGALTPLPFSPIAGIANERIVKVHPSGSPLLVGGDVQASYVITQSSATPAANSPYAYGATVTPAGSTFSREGNYYYAGGNTSNLFAGFAVDAATGVLTALANSPFDTTNPTPLPTATDATGRLFVTNARNGLIRVYTTDAGVPTQVANSPFSVGATGFGSRGEVLPNNKFFVLSDRTNNRVNVFQINGAGAATTLTAVIGSPFATGGTLSSSLAFNQNGKYLFVQNGSSRNLTAFGVNQATGALTNLGVLPANTLGATGTLNGIAYVNFAPTAAAVSVAGRVTANGKGLAKARVSIVGGDNATRSALTDSFGNFAISEVNSGATYVITVSAKQYDFAPQVVTLNESIGDLTFTAR